MLTGTVPNSDSWATPRKFDDSLHTHFEDFIISLHNSLLPTAPGSCINVQNINLKCLFGNVISMLQLLLKLDEEHTKLVISKSYHKLKELLLVLCNYASWMLCSELNVYVS